MIVFARVAMTPDSDGGSEPAVAPDHQDQLGDRVACLDVVEGRQRGRVLALDRVRSYVVGRLPGAELHVDDPGVSRRHVRVTRHADASIEATDMRSTNGLIVNGERHERTLLREGDELALGPDAVLRLRYRDRDQVRAALEQVAAPSVEASHTLSEPTLVEGTRPGVAVDRGLLEPAPISARQLEVGRLVAQGLSNAAIAEALGISRRTVTTHLDHIYTRLNINSRAALTRWLIERDLTE